MSNLWNRTKAAIAVAPGMSRVSALLRVVVEPLRHPDRWDLWKHGPLARLRRSERMLALAVGVSIILHGLLLLVRFQFPDAPRSVHNQTLEVVLVNSKTRQRPSKAEVMAQANLDGGGNTDENRRARTPLPVLNNERDGDSVKQAQMRVQELEAQQKQLLSQVRPSAQSAPVESPAPATPTPEKLPVLRGVDLANESMRIARLEAQVSRQLDEYAKRPRKNFVGARASEYRFAQYVDDWRMKVERIGNINYPEAARGKLYGSLELIVEVQSSGEVREVYVNRSSGHPILDQAAIRIVRMSAPFAAFPPSLRRDTDILVITRTWHFAPGDRLLGDP